MAGRAQPRIRPHGTSPEGVEGVEIGYGYSRIVPTSRIQIVKGFMFDDKRRESSASAAGLSAQDIIKFVCNHPSSILYLL